MLRGSYWERTPSRSVSPGEGGKGKTVGGMRAGKRRNAGGLGADGGWARDEGGRQDIGAQSRPAERG